MEKWEDPQIETFLGLLNMKKYARGSLDSYWNTVNKIAITLGKPISQKHKRMYDNIRINAKELKDDRLPVSAALLVQLCDSANLFFNDYTASLAKAIFTCAWSFSMRVSEYSGSKTSGRNVNTSHNIRKNSVRTSRVGLTITFESDKTTKFGKSIKHRTVIWSKIPVNAKDIVDYYTSLRPKDAAHFFCAKDGAPLKRSDVLNILHTCLLGTDWRYLNITPHSFCQGRVKKLF